MANKYIGLIKGQAFYYR